MAICDVCGQSMCDECGGCGCPGNDCMCDFADSEKEPGTKPPMDDDEIDL